jgi:hypothetical protein
MRRYAAAQEGQTLVELLVAAFVLVVGVLGVFALLDGANATTVTNNVRVGATNLARELLEDARTVDYDQLVPTRLPAALGAFPGINSTGNPLTVVRGNTTYTVQVNVCAYDDPQDGLSTTAPQNPCSAAPASVTTADSNPDDFRRVTLTLTWNRGDGARRLQQTALIVNPSGGLGPRITRFDSPATNAAGNPAQITDPAATSASFPTTTTTTAQAVHWTSDGQPNGSGDATGGPPTWATTWNLGHAATPLPAAADGTVPVANEYDPGTTVLDGVYLVTAQAFDDRGIAGDSRFATLPLNRSLPLTVNGFQGGFNGSDIRPAVDLSWQANPERDIVGYRVYRSSDATADSSDRLICGGSGSTPWTTGTNCYDADPYPNNSSNGQEWWYYAKAVDRTDITDPASAPRESQYPSALVHVVLPPTSSLPLSGAPDAPQSLAIDPTQPAQPTFTWTDDSPSTVAYYWIYRDGCQISNRYMETAGNGAASTWTDTAPLSGTHTYYVTAVDGTSYRESACSNGVSYP